MLEQEPAREERVQWAKVIDHTRCIGCHACTTACKSENVVPIGVTRTYVKHVDVGVFPQVRRAHQVTRCNQCVHAPCVTACPTAAMFKRADGIVDFGCSSAATASSISINRSASAARPAWPPVLTTLSSSIPKITPRRNVTSARIVSMLDWSRRASSSVRHRPF